nr:MAG TPA: hypothetical protein [Caudoviricetes sp.]
MKKEKIIEQITEMLKEMSDTDIKKIFNIVHRLFINER